MAAPKEGESALIVPVALPAALEQLRDRFDPSATQGVPGHITLLYPFMPQGDQQDEVLTRVAQIATAVPAFSFTLGRVQRWPDVVCLLPDPSEPFSRLIRALADDFPDYPPYAGAHAVNDIVPHVTIAQSRRPEDLDAAQEALSVLEAITVRCAEVAVIARHPGQHWQLVWRHRLPVQLDG
jgi:2'-5' RNA ligase